MWMDTNSIALGLTALTALGACASAIASLRSADKAKKAVEGSFFYQLRQRYSSREMEAGLKRLKEWQVIYGDEFVKNWTKAVDDNTHTHNTLARAIESDRRQVTNYFFDILWLYKLGYIKKKTAKKLIRVDGINILYDIVEPLEEAKNPLYDRASFIRLRRICPRFIKGDGIVF